VVRVEATGILARVMVLEPLLSGPLSREVGAILEVDGAGRHRGGEGQGENSDRSCDGLTDLHRYLLVFSGWTRTPEYPIIEECV
jgi:hypothetical protein